MSLTEKEQDRLDYLKMLVSVRVEEYFEAPDADDTSIPFGDIEYELTQAARYVMRKVRRNLSFFATKSYDYGVVIELDNKNGGLVPLPSDYQRFTRLKMNGWDRPVNNYKSDESSAYRQQQFTMRRGTVEKPVAFIVPFARSFEAGTAPELLAKQTLGRAIPHEGDALNDVSDNEVAVVKAADDPDYVYITPDENYSPTIGDLLTYDATVDGEDISYTLEVKYLDGDTYDRQTEARQALEVYPYADGTVERLTYVPYVKPWEVPAEFEDMLVWRAASSVFTTMNRYNEAKAALEQMALAEQVINTGMYGEERREQ